jgi:hypothetical protein
MKSLVTLSRRMVALALLALSACAQTTQPALCSSVVARLVNQLIIQVPVDTTARVEVRRCIEDGTDSLQIVAWEAKAARPSLLIDTTDFTIVQMAARQNLYLIETTGGPRDRIYVVLFENGKPTLRLQKVTKGTAQITMLRDSLDLVIPDIYAGDLPPRTEKYHYQLQ